MTLIRPFKGWIASNAHCGRVPIKHIDSYSSDAIKEELSSNPYSFLHVLAPSIHSSSQLDLKERFSLVRERLFELLFSGVYRELTQESLWVYQIKSARLNATGVVGITPISAYVNQAVKRHEQTKAARRDTLAVYLDEVGIHADPVVLAFSDNKDRFKSWCSNFTESNPPSIEISVDQEVHQLWQLSDPKHIVEIQLIIERNEITYIVDGHHRIESSLHYANSKQEIQGALDRAHFMSFFIAEDDLNIQSVAKQYTVSINAQDCLKRLDSCASFESCDLEVAGEEHLLQINEQSYLIRLSENKGLADLVKCLDNLPQTTSKSDSVTTLVFRPKAYTVDDLKRAAESEIPMAAKSTYIEPKLLTGLLIYPIA